MKYLVFVYNADSGLFNTVTDIAHKIISPSTYSCNLCSLTHSYFTVRKEWTDFLSTLDVDLEFLHKDELKNKYGLDDIPLPVILIKHDDKLDVWMSKNDINTCLDVDSLKKQIAARL